VEVHRDRLLVPSREAVEAHIESQHELKFDGIIDAENIVAEVVPEAVNKSMPMRYYDELDCNKTFNFSRSAFGQLMNRVKVPLQFYDRCPKALRVAIFDHFVTGDKEKKFLFRNIHLDNERQQVRAVLSEKYSRIDDHHVFPVVLEALADEEVEIQSFTYDDRVSQLLLHFSDTECHHEGTDYVAGLLVSNSETGHSAVWLEPVVTMPSCSFVNRRSLRAQKIDMRIIHKGDVDPQRIRDMAQNTKEIAQVGILQLAEAWETKVKATYALTYAKGIDALPKRLYDILEEEWSEEQELYKAEVARRIILLAKELPLFNAIPVEQSAGQFLGLFNSYKTRISQIMEEME